MIGSHNSFTYLKPIKKIYKFFSWFWKTQNKTIKEQYKIGVRYFDVRVRQDNNHWVVCHGKVDLDLKFSSLEELCIIFQNMDNCKLRLILERGDDYKFKQEIKNLINKYSVLSFIGIKKGWEELFNNDPIIFDYTYTPWLSGLNFWQNIKRFNFLSTIKRHANKHNVRITPMLIKDKYVYFMDYINY